MRLFVRQHPARNLYMYYIHRVLRIRNHESRVKLPRKFQSWGSLRTARNLLGRLRTCSLNLHGRSRLVAVAAKRKGSRTMQKKSIDPKEFLGGHSRYLLDVSLGASRKILSILTLFNENILKHVCGFCRRIYTLGKSFRGNGPRAARSR